MKFVSCHTGTLSGWPVDCDGLSSSRNCGICMVYSNRQKSISNCWKVAYVSKNASNYNTHTSSAMGTWHRLRWSCITYLWSPLGLK